MLLDMTRVHVPVLAGELIELLDPQAGEVVVDCTFGAGGHARLIAERIGPTGTLIAIDRDPVAEEHFDELAAELICRTRFLHASFVDGLTRLREEGVTADALYLDLGMSSMQVDTRERGFSYSYDAPLDMRMDPDQDFSARELVNEWEERQIARVLRDFGDERYAGPIARAIVRERGPRSDRNDQRPRRGDLRRDPRARAIRRRPPGQAHLPGDPDRRQRRARAARPGTAAGVGRAPRRWPICRDFVSLRRGSTRKAIPRGPRTWMYLPTRSAAVRMRSRARGRTALAPCRGRESRRGRRQPPIRVGASARRAQARMTPPVDNAGTLRRPLAPRTPRRISGPARAARPARSGGATDARRARTAGRLRRVVHSLPDARGLDRLVRGRAWIAIIACALVGIVYLQVSLLGMNAGITRSLAVAQHLEAQNSQLQSEIAQAGAGGRVQDAAARAGMVLPPAAWAQYLTVGRTDAARAAILIRPPDANAELRNAAANAALAPPDALPTLSPQASQTAATAPAIAPSADGTAPTAQTATAIATADPAATPTQPVTPPATSTPTVAAAPPPTSTPVVAPTPTPAVSSTSSPSVSSGAAAPTGTPSSTPAAGGGVTTGGVSPSVAAGPG